MWSLFFTFFKVGAFTIGGGLAMLPILQKELVDRHRLLTPEEFLDLTALSQTLPGIIAVNFAVFVGNKIRGRKGAVVAATGAILPSFFIILAIAVFFHQYKDHDVVVRIFKGIRPAVVALLLIPVFTLARSAGLGWRNAWIPLATVLLIWLLGVSPVYIMLIAAALAVVWCYARRRKNRKK